MILAVIFVYIVFSLRVTESVTNINHTAGHSKFKDGVSGMDIPHLAVYTGQTDTESFMIRANLKDMFSVKGPLTVFGPSNLAWFELSSFWRKFLFLNNTALREVLLYHSINTRLYTSQFHNEQLIPSLLPGCDIRLNIYKHNTVYTASGAVLIKSNQNATNGVVHTLNAVMSIPTGSIYTLVQSTTGFTILRQAVKIAGLISLLNGPHPLTMFAPSDAAFSKLSATELQNLMSDPRHLADILQYHVLNGTLYTAAFTNGEKLQAYNGKYLTFNINTGVVEVEGIGLSLQDMSTTNGVVHVIDTLLFPSNVKSFKWDNK